MLLNMTITFFMLIFFEIFAPHCCKKKPIGYEVKESIRN